jgi:Ran-binding protein 1
MLNKNTGTKTWNERGVGDIKFLKHKETTHIRVLMRQEKTMKIIVNHFLDPRITLTPNAGASDKSWVWVAFDFADGVELVESTFAIRFKTPEQAQEFEKEFKACQAEMTKVLAGVDATPASEEEKKETDELASAVDSLAVKEEDKKEESA